MMNHVLLTYLAMWDRDGFRDLVHFRFQDPHKELPNRKFDEGYGLNHHLFSTGESSCLFMFIDVYTLFLWFSMAHGFSYE